MTSLDQWWLRIFRKLLDAEQWTGKDPEQLTARWLVLNLHERPTPRRPRWILGFALPEAISHFLNDSDVRAKDAHYAQMQWAEAREWLNA